MIHAEIRQTLENILSPILERHQAFLVELALKNERRGTVVQAFIDTDKGIRIEECAEISREFGAVLETKAVFERSYHLEVSSPGIDKPLRLLRQYPKNIGRSFAVRYRADDGVQSLEGTLEGVEGELLTFAPKKGQPVSLRFSQIVESKELLPW